MELDHESFDLGEVLSGAAFPELDVEVFFDETVGFALHQADKQLRRAEILGEQEVIDDLEEKIAELRKQADGVKFIVTLRGLPESTRKVCNLKARKKYEPEVTFLGTEQPDPERDDYFNALLWQHSIVKVTDPKGRVAVPTEDDILKLRNAVGRTAVKAITDGVKELSEGPMSAFESDAQEKSFLPDA